MEITTVGPKQAKIIPNFLSTDELAIINGAMKEREWIPRFGGALESYGRVWYLDIESGLLPHYHYGAAKTNAAVARLPNLHDKMVSAVEHLLNGHNNSSFGVRLKLPREHAVNVGIVRSAGLNGAGTTLGKGKKKAVTDFGGVAHSDLEGIAAHPSELWNFKDSRAYSAVLCLEAPESGGGLRFWPRRRRVGEWGAVEGERYTDFEYTPGSMMIFDSWCYHQILPSTYTREHPRRMIAGIHFLWRETPEPHWEYWF